MKCPSCGTENDGSIQFCLNCGAGLQKSTKVSTSKAVSSPTIATMAEKNEPASSVQKSTTTLGETAVSPSTPIHKYGNTKTSTFNIWGPFAGYGARQIHKGWVMDNQGDKADDLVNKVKDKFEQRKIPNTTISKEELTGRGLLVEQRPYFLLKRELILVALHISQFGRDLFISLASYLKPPISNLRSLIVGLMIFLQIYMSFAFPTAIAKAFSGVVQGFNLFSSSSGDPGSLIGLVCILGPLGSINSFLLTLLFFYSIYKWFTEKDFLAALRVTPNEFNEDDLMAMEQAVEQTVRVSLDEIGLNLDDFVLASNKDDRRVI